MTGSVIEHVKLLDRLAYWLGYKRLAFVNYDPPPSLYKNLGDGKWWRPPAISKTEVVLVFNWRARLRLLISGKVQIVSCVWWAEETPAVAGDVFRWEVLPPQDKVDPQLRV